MKKFKEKRMASYVFRSNELIQEGKTANWKRLRLL